MLSQLKAQVESMESDLKARLEAGANVKQGVPIANLERGASRCCRALSKDPVFGDFPVVRRA